MYFVIGSGVAKYDTGVASTTGSVVIDDETETSKILVGMSVGMGFMFEAYYSDLGEVRVTANAGDTLTTDDGTTTTFGSNNTQLLYMYQAYGVNAVYRFDLGSYGFHLKAGVVHWSLDYEASVAGTVFNSRSDSGDEMLLGFGLKYSLATAISLFLDYEQTTIDDYDVQLMAAGIQVGF